MLLTAVLWTLGSLAAGFGKGGPTDLTFLLARLGYELSGGNLDGLSLGEPLGCHLGGRAVADWQHRTGKQAYAGDLPCGLLILAYSCPRAHR